MSEPKKIDYKKVFEACNVELREGSGTQLGGDCPFCEKRNYLFVDPESGKWDCKKCLETGNVYTFIRQWHNLTVDDRDVKALAKVRPGIGSRTLEQSRIGYDAVTDSWIIPSYMVKDGKYKVRSLRRWTADPKEIHSFPQLKCGIYIAHWSEDPNSNVWVLEGEWDAEAFHRLMEYVGFDDTVIGLPGAGSFPKEDLTWVEGRSVRLIYDNDSPIVRKNKTIRPGFDGMNKAIDKFRELGVAQLMVCGWGDLPAPIDVRDLCVKYFKEPSTAWNTINEMLITPEAFRVKEGYGASSSSAESDEPLPESIDSFEQVMEEYGRVYEITDMFERCIACAFACIVSNRLPGDQLWMFLVGPPSCLAGDNKVIINRAGKSYPITLEELYHKFNNTGMYNGEWREDIPTTIQHRDDHGCVRLIEVRDVMFSGEKCIYELTTKTGRVIRASEDHRFLTPDGWRRLKQLQVGGYVLSTQGRVDIHREKQWAPKYKQVVGLKYHPNANTRNPRIISDGFKVVQHRLVVEADMNDLSNLTRTNLNLSSKWVYIPDPIAIIRTIIGIDCKWLTTIMDIQSCRFRVDR